MASNTNTQITSLDFTQIKQNFKNYLQSQSQFTDYNFDGSGLSVLLDVLAYNTQYNAFYLNMVANEMFLDTAIQRASVVSHAKLLDYTPKSASAPTAFINLTAYNVTDSSLTLPVYTNFLSGSIDGVNYNFVNINPVTENTSNGTVTFANLELKQGIPVTYSYVVDSTSNPNFVFELPDNSIDTSTLSVIVQESSSSSSISNFSLSTNYISLDSTSQVYFLDEALNGNYQISFGDGILGQKLSDGNVVTIKYLVTQGSAAAGANTFVMVDSVTGFTTTLVTGVTSATTGGGKESIDSIKFTAPKTFAAQNRAVTKDDYITLIQENNQGFSFDAVNVWGGEENSPPVYGQVFVCLKPTGAYSLTETQKLLIAKNVIQPISILTVRPTIVDPDYNYVQVISNVLYNSKSTNYTSSQISQLVSAAIQQFGITKLNTFNATFTVSDLIIAIQNADSSIVTNDTSIRLQKKIYPLLNTPTTYTLNYNTPLKKGILTSGVSSSPALQFTVGSSVVDGVYIEETPSSTGGISSISLLNPGYSYTATPTVTILGDGSGATAEAIVVAGVITGFTVTNPGSGYTQAVVTITNAAGDTSGIGASAVAILEGQFGTIRTYYYNSNNVKTILNSNAGTIDYTNGIITLQSFDPVNIDNALGQLAISVEPQSTIVTSSLNKILTIDSFDPNAIQVTVTSK